jgi:hypothetical protein
MTDKIIVVSAIVVFIAHFFAWTALPLKGEES